MILQKSAFISVFWIGILCLFSPAEHAAAHPLAPALLELTETDAGRFEVRWKTPSRLPADTRLTPILPESCTDASSRDSDRDRLSATLTWSVDCETPGLVGELLGVRGISRRGASAVVRVVREDGVQVQGVVSRDRPLFTIPVEPSRFEVFHRYTRLGIEHLWFGLDHVLFILGLLLLVHRWRDLLLTVTAFTLGHSVTLCLAALGVVRLPTAQIEVLIALTLVWLAWEVLGEDKSSRWSPFAKRPWRMAAVFGLLHGFGFAGALSQVGLPQSEIPVALLAFNVGIELGQLTLIAVSALIWLVLSPVLKKLSPRILRTGSAYVVGTLAAYWAIERLAAVV